MNRRQVLTTAATGGLIALAGCLDEIPAPRVTTDSEVVLTDDLEYDLALFGTGQIESMGLGVSRLETVEGTWAVSIVTGTKQWHLGDYLLKGQPVATKERLLLPCETESATDGPHLLGDNPGSLLSVDSQDGQTNWELRDDEHGFQGVASNGEAVLAWTAPPPGTSGTLYCLDIEDGDQRWSVPMEDHDKFDQLRVWDGTLVVRDDHVVIPTDRGLIALDLTNSDLVWRFQPEARPSLDLAIGADVIYLPDRDGALYAIDADAGDTRWRFSLPPPDEGMIERNFDILSYNAGLIVGRETKRERNWAISTHGPDAGERRWFHELDGSVPFPEAITIGSDQVYVGARQAGGTDVIDLLAVDADTGSIEWKSSMEGTPAPRVVETDFGLIVPWGAGQDSPLQVLDTATGDVLESFPDIGQRVWSLIVDTDRGIVTTKVQRDDGNVLVGSDLSTGEHRWTFEENESSIYRNPYGV